MIGYSDVDTMEINADSRCVIGIHDRMRQYTCRDFIRNTKTNGFLFFQMRGYCIFFGDCIAFLTELPRMIIKCFGCYAMLLTPGTDL